MPRQQQQGTRTASFFFMSAATTPMPCLIATLLANSDAASCCFDSQPDFALVSMSSHHLKLPGGSFLVPRRIKRFRTWTIVVLCSVVSSEGDGAR